MAAAALLFLLFLAPTPARCAHTIDLLWADTGTASLPASIALDSDRAVNPICRGGLYTGPATGHCLTVQLRASEPFVAALNTLGWNASASGIGLGFAPANSHGKFGRNPPLLGFGARAIVSASPLDCPVPGCDTALGSFGGEAGSHYPAGTYLLGSLVLDLTEVRPGTHALQTFVRDGLDGVFTSGAISRPTERNGAFVLTPEPASALLLGAALGALAQRRRRLRANRTD